jgi:hypothetical protein
VVVDVSHGGSMKTGSQKHLLHLAGFAGATLQILQDDPDWSADTLEQIELAARDWQLAGTDDHGKFEIINLDKVTEVNNA